MNTQYSDWWKKKYFLMQQHELNCLLFRREQEELLRQKEAERRTAIEEKENARVSYREKMKNATVIDVSKLIHTSNTYRLIFGNRSD